MIGTPSGNSTLWKRATVCAMLPALFALPAPSDAAAGTTACFTGSPATPVPEFVNNERIWPPSGLQPAMPGEQLPVLRDSTKYVGLPSQLPGAGGGTELWTDLDIVGNYIYTAYNSGVQVWDIAGANAADPKRMAFRDGWANNHFLNFEHTPTEVYFLLFGIDAIDPPGGGEDVLIAAAGHDPVGLTLWDATDKTSLRRLYQDWDLWSEDVVTAHVNGRTYAFFAVGKGGAGGLHVYDMTAARTNFLASNGCLEDTTAGISCNGVYKGEMGAWSKVMFVSHLERNGRHFIAVSDGSSGYGIDIHEVLNPAIVWSNPVFSGLSSSSQGVELFEHGGRAYMAAKGATAMEIHDVTTCLDSGNCANLQTPSPVWTSSVVGTGTAGSLVSVSKGANPYVYFGDPNPCLRGTKKEYLYNVNELGSANPTIEEATAFPAGSPANDDGLFQDASSGQLVDYWGFYLDRNTSGFSYMVPRAAKVHRASNGAEYVYRAGFTVFDVHVFGDFTPPPNEPSSTITGPGSGWLGDTHAFTATPQNCDGTADWQWWYEEGGQTFTLGQDDATHSERWNVGADRTLAVGATRLACDGGGTMLDENIVKHTINLDDPRPQIPGLTPSSGQFPQGQKVNFSVNGTVSGKSPTYEWQVLSQSGDPLPLPDETVTNEVLFELDTCDLNLKLLTDGFETGDVGQWSFSQPVVPNSTLLAKATQGVPFTVELTATSTVEEGSFNDEESVVIEVLPPGAPMFNEPPITSTEKGVGTYDLAASTNGLETEVRWQIEDVTGESLCDFGQGDIACVVYDWPAGRGSLITHQWFAPNVAGLHKVSAEVRSLQCDGSSLPPVPPYREIDVDVTDVAIPVDPEIDGFNVEPGGAANCQCSIFSSTCDCNANQPVTFKVTTNVPVGNLDFTWGDGQTQIVQQANDDLYTHSYSAGGFKTVTVKIVGETATESITVNILGGAPE